MSSPKMRPDGFGCCSLRSFHLTPHRLPAARCSRAVAATSIDAKRKISKLRGELRSLVESESYKEAAKLRDEIKLLEELVPEIVLKRALTAASQKEDYQECARIRDELKKLNIQLLSEEDSSAQVAAAEDGVLSCSSSVTTRGINVSVKSFYAPQMSFPSNGQFVFGYRVQITNTGNEVVQLKSRHWIIKDGAGKTQEVRGPGVIGEEPVLEPGRSFSYTSACPLNTNHGSMEGRYNMISLSENNDSFDVSIGEFKLDATASP